MALSEVAELQQRIAKENMTAQLGLSGLASGSSRHEIINARMERGANYILGLMQAGKHEEAQVLMQAKTWADIEVEMREEEERGTCHTTILS